VSDGLVVRLNGDELTSKQAQPKCEAYAWRNCECEQGKSNDEEERYHFLILGWGSLGGQKPPEGSSADY
jgi:hypothetical protein